MELLRFKKLLSRGYWFYVKATFLILGSAASVMTFFSGKLIEAMFQSPVVTLHSKFALSTVIIYGILAISYLLTWFEKDFYTYINNYDVLRKIIELNKNIFRPRVIVVLAFLGLLAVLMTGTLGGIVAFGPGVDPMTLWVNNLFFKNESY